MRLLGPYYPFPDFLSLVHDPDDGTKQMRIDVGAVSAGTVRVLTMPDADVDLTPATGTYVQRSLFDANTILAADSDNTPAAVTVGEQAIVGRITGGQITALTGTQAASILTDLVNKSLFDAHTILAANSDNTPAAVTVDEARIIGRATGGNIAALTAAQVNAITETAVSGTGTVPSVTGLAGAEVGNSIVHRTTLTLTNVAFPITRDGGDDSGYGALKIYEFPEGAVIVDATIASLSVDVSAEANISDTGSGDFAIGTAGTTDSNVATPGDNINILTATELTDPFVAGVGSGSRVAKTSGDPTFVDGTSSAVEAFLNLAFDAGDVTTGDGTAVVSGTIIINWRNCGDIA